jgi:GWxTD domain-containing protein
MYAGTAAERREAFFRTFWARREPDLNTAVNERIAEHFVRLAHARTPAAGTSSGIPNRYSTAPC